MRLAILIVTSIVLLSAFVAHAVPLQTAERDVVPALEFSQAQDTCHLLYYNYCSSWVHYWHGYCFGLFLDGPELPKFGTCFDLSDCPAECRHLGDVWWAWKHYGAWNAIDCEIFCADEYACPVGPPVAGFYDVYLFYPPWQRFPFGDIPLCVCEDAGFERFIVMMTFVRGYEGILPYSDLNSYNIAAGCEAEWRCEGHSYCYRNLVSYCDVYGCPGPLWVSGANYGCTNYPTVPPGCHNYWYPTGYFSEWLIHCYLSCLGPTVTEQESWSEIKGLYR
jgi:hypothetical protein